MKRLKEMTLQEVFDAVCKHAATMPHASAKPSKGPRDVGNGCLYRGDGTMCFVGALIQDDEYVTGMENKDVYDIAPLLGIDGEQNWEKRKLLDRLQSIHDSAVSSNADVALRARENWFLSLHSTAVQWGLNPAAADQVGDEWYQG